MIIVIEDNHDRKRENASHQTMNEAHLYKDDRESSNKYTLNNYMKFHREVMEKESTMSAMDQLNLTTDTSLFMSSLSGYRSSLLLDLLLLCFRVLTSP